MLIDEIMTLGETEFSEECETNWVTLQSA